MIYYIVRFLACLFAVYGVFTLISCIIEAVRSRSVSGTSKVKVVVVVRDVEDQIENIVRNAYKAELATRLMSDGNITFIDMDSQDGTLVLLNQLKKDYENIEILEVKERDMAFSGFDAPNPNYT